MFGCITVPPAFYDMAQSVVCLAPRGLHTRLDAYNDWRIPIGRVHVIVIPLSLRVVETILRATACVRHLQSHHYRTARDTIQHQIPLRMHGGSYEGVTSSSPTLLVLLWLQQLPQLAAGLRSVDVGPHRCSAVCTARVVVCATALPPRSSARAAPGAARVSRRRTGRRDRSLRSLVRARTVRSALTRSLRSLARMPARRRVSGARPEQSSAPQHPPRRVSRWGAVNTTRVAFLQRTQLPSPASKRCVAGGWSRGYTPAARTSTHPCACTHTQRVCTLQICARAWLLPTLPPLPLPSTQGTPAWQLVAATLRLHAPAHTPTRMQGCTVREYAYVRERIIYVGPYVHTTITFAPVLGSEPFDLHWKARDTGDPDHY
jgi:hypothetical protein